jgi:hypothetical protein
MELQTKTVTTLEGKTQDSFILCRPLYSHYSCNTNILYLEHPL